jgi:hypothetical protein
MPADSAAQEDHQKPELNLIHGVKIPGEANIAD